MGRYLYLDKKSSSSGGNAHQLNQTGISSITLTKPSQHEITHCLIKTDSLPIIPQGLAGSVSAELPMQQAFASVSSPHSREIVDCRL